jgi:hypothetical protein
MTRTRYWAVTLTAATSERVRHELEIERPTVLQAQPVEAQ